MPETIEKTRQGHLGRKPFLGCKHSLETRDKMRQAHLGLKASPETLERMRQANLGRCLSPETREKQRQALLGRGKSPEHREKVRQTLFGRKVSPETREKHRQNRLRQTFPTQMTSIECLLRDEFRKRRLHFEMHKTMFGRFQPDFVFESAWLIVQADGDYWHRPGSVNAKRDQAFNVAATAAGWSVWRFGGREIEMHALVCAGAVATFVHSHGRDDGDKG